jgi:hypothetical protein
MSEIIEGDTSPRLQTELILVDFLLTFLMVFVYCPVSWTLTIIVERKSHEDPATDFVGWGCCVDGE